MIQTIIKIDEGYTIHTCSGELCSSEFKSAIESFYEKTPTNHVIWDMAQVSRTAITPEILLDIINSVKQFSHIRINGRTAIITANTLTFQLSRFVQTYLEISSAVYETKVFTELSEATVWIKRQK